MILSRRPALRAALSTLVLAGTALAASVTALPGVANSTAAPSLTVKPGHHIAPGQQVQVTATGITSGASVRVNLCDEFSDDFDNDCFDLTSTTASASGAVSMPLTLPGVVYRNIEDVVSVPVYCRNDGCQLTLIWTDPTGADQVLTSPALQFQGAEAHIHVKPASNLYKRQMVDVHGHVYGAQHHRIAIVEEACYQIVQGTGCYGQLPAVTTRVSGAAGYDVKYEARRFLSDGTDCNDPDMLGGCVIGIVVYNAAGQPDDTFGVSSDGDPSVHISFRDQPVTPTG